MTPHGITARNDTRPMRRAPKLLALIVAMILIGALPAMASDSKSGTKNCVDNFVRTTTYTVGLGTTTHFSNGPQIGQWMNAGSHVKLTAHYLSNWVETITNGTGTFSSWGAVCSGIS